MFRFEREVSNCFRFRASTSADLACRYEVCLPSETQLKNMEHMGKELGLWDDSYRATQQFISTSRWDESLLCNRMATRADERPGGTSDPVVSIDESFHAKKGQASVGVARQLNGRLGKEDNCQTSVYRGLTCGTRVCLMSSRLVPADRRN